MDNPIKISPVKLSLPLDNFSSGQLLHLAATFTLLLLFNRSYEKFGISWAFDRKTQRLLNLWDASNLLPLALG
jgi:hypothetical protein